MRKKFIGFDWEDEEVGWGMVSFKFLVFCVRICFCIYGVWIIEKFVLEGCVIEGIGLEFGF